MLPACNGRSPAISRNRLVLPAPFGPVTSRLSPGSRAKLKRSNRTRPPRWQLIALAARLVFFGICPEFAQVGPKRGRLSGDAVAFSRIVSPPQGPLYRRERASNSPGCLPPPGWLGRRRAQAIGQAFACRLRVVCLWRYA